MMNTIQSLEEYVLEIEQVIESWHGYATTALPWFRGQSDANWNLVPSIYRHNNDGFYEREMVRDFRLRSSAFLDKEPNNYLEWLFIMQHYGVPTRLLDWTESYLVALYFSVASLDYQNDGCVWILHPWLININTIHHKTVPIVGYPDLSAYVLSENYYDDNREIEAKLPVAIRPKKNTPRIIAQKGAFTIHGSLKKGLDVIIENEFESRTESEVGGFKKIIIDRSSKKKILNQLYLSGISHSLLFPDLDGLAKEIKVRFSLDFMLPT